VQRNLVGSFRTRKQVLAEDWTYPHSLERLLRDLMLSP
jgi:hypothetical protein